jgi:hypothetical protein
MPILVEYLLPRSGRSMLDEGEGALAETQAAEHAVRLLAQAAGWQLALPVEERFQVMIRLLPRRRIPAASGVLQKPLLQYQKACL